MNLKEMSDEELLNEFYNTLLNVMVPRDQYFKNAQAKHAELLSRLARGRKAIETMEKIKEHIYKGEPNVSDDCYKDGYRNALEEIEDIIKEVTDDQG